MRTSAAGGVLTEPVRWRGGALVFEVRSGAPAVLARAARIFAPWACAGGEAPAGRWRIDPVALGGRETGWEVDPDPPGPGRAVASVDQALLAVEWAAVQAIVDHTGGPLAFHAALVARGDRGLLLAGPSEAGKSTLAAALWQRGWRLLCDDVALVDPVSGRARPTPRRVSLRASARALLGEDLWRRIEATPCRTRTPKGLVFHPSEVDRGAPATSVALVGGIFLGRRGAAPGPGRLVRLEPAHALLALLPYANLARRLEPGEAIRQIQPLAARMPIHDLGRAALPEMARALDRLLGSSS